MRNDAGVNGDAQRIEQMVWILFLKIYDEKEKDWEFLEDNYQSIIPERLRWRNWAHDNKDGEALTGDNLIRFVNIELLEQLKALEITDKTPKRQVVVQEAFQEANNYMKKGVLLRQVINEIDAISLESHKDKHALGDIYESILLDLQSAGNAGEFYTPRALTDFIVEMIKPRLGERVADFACGTGGFLTSTLNYLDKQVTTVEHRKLYSQSVYGVEKKPFPYLLCTTNMILHGVENIAVTNTNSLETNVREYKTQEDKFDVILMNPPYGGNEEESIKRNFPAELRCSETADLFVALILYRLKKTGRAAVVLPEGFMFGTDGTKLALKKKLMSEFNLHTVIRLPHSIFAPYTSIRTNVIFFDAGSPTNETWFYRLDMPEGYKNFSKTKPMQLSHFAPLMEWWDNREEINIDGFDKAKKYTIEELASLDYTLDLCGFPQEETIILSPDELLNDYYDKRQRLNDQIDTVLKEISTVLGLTHPSDSQPWPQKNWCSPCCKLPFKVNSSPKTRKMSPPASC